MTAPGAAFYCMSSEAYFLGAVGMVNSLRLHGHDEPIHLLDLGLADWQRQLLDPHVELLAAPDDTPPWLQKTVAPLRHPAETMVLIDADMIVTRRLDELIERAARGSSVAFEHGSDRNLPEWGELLELGEVRRQTYVCSGFLALPRDLGAVVLPLMRELADRVDARRAWFEGRDLDYPLLFLDQDLLNAILASRVERGRQVVLDRRLEAIPPFDGLEVVDAAAVRCAYADGVEPFALHHFTVKPWLRPTPRGPYTRLLERLLRGDDVPIQIREQQLPPHMRTGLLARARRRGKGVRERVRSLARAR